MAARHSLSGAALLLCCAGAAGALAAWPLARALWPPPPAVFHPERAAALSAAAAAAPSERALQPEAEAGLRSFLRLVATELNLAHEPIELVPEPVQAGVIPIRLKWSLRGDPFDLPVLLAALHQLRHTVAVERVDVRPLAGPDLPPGVAEIRLQARLLRAAPPEPAHFDAALQARGGLGPPEREQLADAAHLLAWRRFHAAEAPLRAAAERGSRAAQRDLPAALIQARRTGAPLRWTAERGLVGGPSTEPRPKQTRPDGAPRRPAGP